MSYKCRVFTYSIPIACCSLFTDRKSSETGYTLTPSYNDVPGMPFVAFFPKFAICILYEEVSDLFTHEPKVTCYISYKSPLNSSYVLA